MNAQDFIYDEADETDFTARKSSSKSTFKSGSGSNSARKTFGRRGKGPTQFNGIHRRRSKKIRW